MKKLLRYSLFSLALMFANQVMAEGVTIDFDNDYATLFPTLTGTSSNDSEDGNFTGETTSTEVSGFTVTVAPAEDAKTPSRIWYTAPRLRMYSGTFTVKGKGIKKIEFTGHSSNFNISTTTGTLDGKTWTGEADEVVFAVAKNTQINKIVINGDGDDTGGDDTKPEVEVKTATCAEIIAGTDGTFYHVTGKCVEIANTVYGNWYLEDTTGKIYIYGTLDKDGNAGKNNSIDAWGIEVGDELTVEGERTTYKETVELKNVKVIEIKKAEKVNGQVWDFTKWSDATVAALKADAAASKTSGWSDVEKAADAENNADPTEASKDNCFWSVAEPNEDGTISANGVVIEELKGLVWNKAYTVKRSLAIAVNYPKALSDYAGPAYLWLGGGKQKIPCFTIPGVKAGSTITMEVESHKTSDARGVELYTGLDADGLVDAATKIGDSFTPTTKDAHTWNIESDCDVIVYNTNGCHIYKITVAAGDPASISTIKENSFANTGIFNLAGQRLQKAQKGLNIINGKKVVIK